MVHKGLCITTSFETVFAHGRWYILLPSLHRAFCGQESICMYVEERVRCLVVDGTFGRCVALGRVSGSTKVRSQIISHGVLQHTDVLFVFA